MVMNMGKSFKKYFMLFSSFFKIGAFTFGGGYAMIPLIQKEVVDHKHWVEDSDILEIIAISESTPGPISVNAATFIGYRIGGYLGAFFATLGLVLPSFLIILAISLVLNEFQNNQMIQMAFNGIRAGVIALVLKGFWSMYKSCPKSKLSYFVMAFAFVVSTFLDVHVLLIILSSAIIGLLVSSKEVQS